MSITYRLATFEDLPEMASVYAAAFPDSLRHFFGDRPSPLKAIADALGLAVRAEPRSNFVADQDGQIVGYCLAPAHTSRLAKACGAACLSRFLLRWITGRYGLGFRALWVLGRDKLQARRQSRNDPHQADAHILSIAVSPDAQGQGVGKTLLRHALCHFDRERVERVRLEVRPDNLPALRLYEKYGFVTVGRTADSQGDWLIMLRPGRPRRGAL
jgi:[ribosomal protein S18]-alanine N-acetyltransferase